MFFAKISGFGLEPAETSDGWQNTLLVKTNFRAARISVTGDDEQKECTVEVTSESEFSPVQSIDLLYEVRVQNKNPDKDIVLIGKQKFHQVKMQGRVKIENYDDLFDEYNGFIAEKKIKLVVFVAVKETRMVECVELIDIFTENPSINDVKVMVNNGTPLYLLKSLLCLQSPNFVEILEKMKVELDVDKFDVENVCDFFQIAHGVDLYLDEDNVEDILNIANKFKMNRILDMCKKALTSDYLPAYKSVTLAKKLQLWEVLPTLLGKAESLSDFKKQQWKMETLPDDIVLLATQKVFELTNKSYNLSDL